MKIVSLFLALALTGVAQTTPRLSRVTQTEVPADSMAEFYAVQRETAEVYKANQSPSARLAWTSLTGERSFVTVTALSSLAQVGEPTWLSKQGDEATRQARQARLRKASGSSTVKIISEQEEAVWNPTPQAAPSPFATVAIYSVKAGKASDFVALMKEATETTKKIGKAKNVYVARVSYGGDAYEYHVVLGYDSLADISSMSAFRTAMGEDAYKAYVEKIGATINSVRREILRFRPEFSYLPTK